MNTRGSAAIWGVVVVLVVISAVLAWTRLAGLPDLGMLLEPDLTVRHVAVDRDMATEEQKFQRGDRLRAISSTAEWHEINNLRELRKLLGPLVAEANPPAVEEPDGYLTQEEVQRYDEELQAQWGDDVVALEYQLLRPVHRFQLPQGVEVEAGQLPPGVEEDDKLVKVDGGLLRGKVGPEGLRNIMANNPDAVLTFERTNAEFTGQIYVQRDTRNPGVLLTFLLALLLVGVVWRLHAESLDPEAAYCIGLGALCLAWIALLVLAFQWVLADQLLVAGVIAGLVLMRPLAIFARQFGQSDGLRGGLIALGLGALVAVVIIVAMTTEVFPHPEDALHGAALVMGLFVIYELAAAGSEGESLFGLGEREGYLGGVVVIALFAAMLALVLDPQTFQEERWRWFAVAVPSLLVFGDVLFAVRYGVNSAMGEVSDRHSRAELIRRYLREMGLEMPHTDLRIVARVDAATVEVGLTKSDVETRLCDDAMADAVEILFAEQTRVPLPEGVDRNSDPMAGIANAMGISLAVVLSKPRGSLKLDDNQVEMALIGKRQSSKGDVPSYASSETLDRAQELWTGPVASAALIEVVSKAAKSAGTVTGGAGSKNEEASPALRRKLERTREEVEQSQEEMAELIQQRDQAQVEAQRIQRRQLLEGITHRPNHPEVVGDLELLEPELVDGLHYLLDTPEPIALGGAVGAGKGFVAYCGHLIDGYDVDKMAIIDTAHRRAEARLNTILGDAGGGTGPGLLKGFEGSLHVRGAQRCDDGRLLALCHQCEEEQIRLYLSFESPDADRRSVFDGRSEVLQELLSHREVVIPRFRHRHGIRLSVLELWLEEWTHRYDKKIEGFSRMAEQALDAYDYPGEVAEAVEIVRLAVLACEFDVIDRENLPLRVREARPL